MQTKDQISLAGKILKVIILLAVFFSTAGGGNVPTARAQEAFLDQTKQAAGDMITIPYTGISNPFLDPSFEAYTPNPYWTESSTNFDTPLCTVLKCTDGAGTAGPHTGSVWGWFGGTKLDETASLSQIVTIPSGPTNLEFYFWIGAADAGSDAADEFTVEIDGVTVFSANATQISSYLVYTLVSVDVSAYADGASHEVTFSSVTTGEIVDFNLDDVALVPTYTISGNAGVGGAVLSYTYGTPQTATADGSGNYSFAIPSGWSGTVTPFKAGFTFVPVDRTYNDVLADQTAQNYTVSLAPLIQDPSFEASMESSLYWAHSSTNNYKIVCTAAACTSGSTTMVGPRTGIVWGWLGGTPKNETASLSQTITIPSDIPNLKLQFYFWIGAAAPGSDAADVFTAKIDGITVFSANATQQGLYPAYILVSVDISAFSNGASHTITFSSVTTGQVVNFNLDDVTLANKTFFDFPADFWALPFIERLYKAGVTGGCSLTPLNYCPDSTVTRAQMAIFLLKGIHGSSYSPPAVGTSTGFTDVPVSYWAAPWIKQLAAEGITGGCGTGIYCPDATVTRAQMAIFLLKAKHTSAYTPPPATGVFTDVPVGYWARAWIEQLALEGITGGCGVGVYCPDSSVTRAQMAVFLVKTFNLP